MSASQSSPRSSLWHRAGEAGLWAIVVLCAGALGWTRLEARETQHAAESIQPLASALSATPSSASANPVMGRLSIKQLNLSVPILANYDPASLTRGVGHVPGTALPGGLGNAVLAGHRDTYFRPLRDVRPGMKIEVATTAGTWAYTIDRTEIVTPDQVSVAEIGERPEMTLITCYPFNFIGAAPKRFIVHAHLLSADPS